jgi:Tol biopolymer transport system component
VAVANGVTEAKQFALAGFAGAGDVLVYHPAETGTEDHLVWLDRRGKEVDSLEDLGPGRKGNLDLAADGRYLAFQRSDLETGTIDVWSIDLSRGVQSRLSFDTGIENGPVWSPDARRIAYVAETPGRWRLMVRPAGVGGGGAATELLAIAERLEVVDWSPDGRFLLLELSRAGNGGQPGLWLVGPRVGEAPRPLIDGPFSEDSGRFSADGRWLVYQSNESGQAEIYLQPFPLTGARWQVSNQGGVAPRWRPDGGEIYYRANGSQMAVGLSLAAEPSLGTPRQLFVGGTNDYEPAPDGQRFLFAMPTRSAEAPLVVMLHWAGALKPR